jgi:hypothetical protein
VAGEGAGGKKAAGPDGSRLTNLEEEARAADERLTRLEANSARMQDDVAALAEATGGMRQQSAKMREAALRVAEVVQVAAKRRRQAGAPQGAVRPPRT